MIKRLRSANKTDLNLWSHYCESLSSAFSSFQILNQNEIVNRIRKIIKNSPTKLLLILTTQLKSYIRSYEIQNTLYNCYCFLFHDFNLTVEIWYSKLLLALYFIIFYLIIVLSLTKFNYLYVKCIISKK